MSDSQRPGLLISETESEQEARELLAQSSKRALVVVPMPRGRIPFGVRTRGSDVLVTSPEAAMARLQAAALAPSRVRAGPDLVVHFEDYESEAELFARKTLRARVCLESWKDLTTLLWRPSLNTVTVIAETSQLPYSFFSSLIDLESKDNGGLPTVGLLTGAEPSVVRWSVAKALLLRPEEQADLFLLGTPPLQADGLFEDVETLWLGDITRDRLADLKGREFLFCGLVSHSNGVDGNFGQSILCPISDDLLFSLPGKPGSEGQPTCLKSSLCQRDPLETRHRFHPGMLRARVVLYDTCAGFLTGSSFSSSSASLGSAFLQGPAAAMVTTFRKKTSTVCSPLIARAMVRDGIPLGEITRFLNRYQAIEFGELPSFVLLGDPAFRLRPGGCRAGTVKEVEGGLELEGWQARTRRLQLNGRGFPVAPDAADVLSVEAREKGSGEVWLFRQKASSPSLRLSREETQLPGRLDTLARGVCRGVDLLDALTTGLTNHGAPIPETLRDLITEAKEVAPVLDGLRQRVASPTRYAEGLRQNSQVFELVEKKLRELTFRLPGAWADARQWVVLHHYYAHVLKAAGPERAVAHQCPACGESVTCKESTGLRGVAREMYTCIRCGVIADVPTGMPVPPISGEDFGLQGESVTQDVTICLPPGFRGPVALTAYFGGFGSEVAACRIACAPDRIDAEAAEDISVRITIDVEPECPDGLFSLVVVGAMGLDLFTAAKYLSVRREED